MRKQHYQGLAALLIAGAMSGAAHAQVTTHPFGQQDGWTLEAEFENGQFQGCSAIHRQNGIQPGYGSMLKLGQTFDRKGKMFILATDYNLPSPSFKTKVQLGFQFFNTQVKMFPPWAGFVLSPKMLKSMKTANFIDLRLGPAGPSFNVMGPNAILKKLDQCVALNKKNGNRQAARPAFPNQGFQPRQQFQPQGSVQPQRGFQPQGGFQPKSPFQQQGSFQKQGTFQPRKPFQPQGSFQNQQPRQTFQPRQQFQQQRQPAPQFQPKQFGQQQQGFQFQPKPQGQIASTYSSPLPPVQGTWRWLKGNGNPRNVSSLKYMGGNNLQYCYDANCKTAAFKMIDGATIEFATDRQNRFLMKRLPNNIVQGQFWLNGRMGGRPDADITMRPK